jgi:hypothetical protein
VAATLQSSIETMALKMWSAKLPMIFVDQTPIAAEPLASTKMMQN